MGFKRWHGPSGFSLFPPAHFANLPGRAGAIYHLRPSQYWKSNRPAPELRVAVAVRNLGSGLKYDSLPFPLLADATIAQNEQGRAIETFLASRSVDEVDVVVQNVSFSELSKSPYKAAVTFQRVVYTPGTRHERSRQTLVAQVDFVFRDHVPNEFVRVNPLGLEIRYFRVDQAFEESR